MKLSAEYIFISSVRWSIFLFLSTAVIKLIDFDVPTESGRGGGQRGQGKRSELTELTIVILSILCAFHPSIQAPCHKLPRQQASGFRPSHSRQPRHPTSPPPKTGSPQSYSLPTAAAPRRASSAFPSHKCGALRSATLPLASFARGEGWLT